MSRLGGVTEMWNGAQVIIDQAGQCIIKSPQRVMFKVNSANQSLLLKALTYFSWTS